VSEVTRDDLLLRDASVLREANRARPRTPEEEADLRRLAGAWFKGAGRLSVAEACESYGISLAMFTRWLARPSSGLADLVSLAPEDFDRWLRDRTNAARKAKRKAKA
jgi:hypothetical protein